MRNVVYAINISIDGCCDHTAFNPGEFNSSEDIYDYHIRLMDEAEQIVYGRKTYELMFPYWADEAKVQSGTEREHEFAEKITAIDKIVFSKTLDSAGWNTQLMNDNFEEEITRLKQQPGKKILVGGVNFPSQLMAAGLVDEFHFLIYPTLVGKGLHLFDYFGLANKIKLKLVETKILGSGCVAFHYVK